MSALAEISRLPVSAAATQQGLEQLSWLGRFSIGVLDAGAHLDIAIDTPEDLEVYRELLLREANHDTKTVCANA